MILSTTGKITISRTSSTSGPEMVEVRITDGTSHIEFATLSLTLENFGRAITGLGHVPGNLELVGLDNVGKQHEHKEETVPFENSTYAQESSKVGKKLAAKALKGFEINGWVGHTSDLFNHHRRTEKGYRVSFRRYTDKSQTE